MKEVEQVLVQNCGLDLEKHGVSYMLAFGYRVNPERPKSRQEANDIIRWVK